MKRALATLGVAGLGLISLTAPAMAAPERVIVCHSDGGTWEPLEFNVNGLNGHDQHPLDIIPPTSQSAGKNWTDAGKLLYVAQCAPLPPGETLPVVVEPPVVTPPVVTPPVEVEPVVEQPVVVPVEQTVVVPPAEQTVVHPPVTAEVVVPPAAAPAAAAVVVPAQPAAATPQVPARTGAAATAPTVLGTNKGYNAQTAVGGTEYSPAWVAGLAALVAAGAAVAVRRRSDASAAG